MVAKPARFGAGIVWTPVAGSWTLPQPSRGAPCLGSPVQPRRPPQMSSGACLQPTEARQRLGLQAAEPPAPWSIPEGVRHTQTQKLNDSSMLTTLMWQNPSH